MKSLRAVLVVSLALLGLQVLAVPAPAVASQQRPRCTISGTSGDDVLRGTRHADVICGRGGDDRLLGRRGDDVLRGGGGDDRLIGGRGDDHLVGGVGDDHSLGGRGDDTLLGHDALTFTDVLRCGPGVDDRAVADPPDDVGADCETVVRNDPPTDITLDPSSVAENQPIGTLVGHLTADDPDPGDTHDFALVAGTGDGDNGSFTVQGDEVRTAAMFDFEAVQELHLRVAATDQDGASFEKALVVTVTDVAENTPPVAVDDTVSTAEDTELDLPVSGAGSPAANDTDPNGDALTVTGVTNPAGGTVGIAAGTISFVPTANLCGAGAGGFDYTASDGNGGSDVGHVTVDITCTPDPAVAHDDSATVIEDALATAVPVLANDSDADGDPLDIMSVTQPAHGAVVITGGGTGLTYAPDANYCNTQLGGSPDTFTYTLTGGNTATVSMTVTCVDDDPVAVADAATVTEDDPAAAVDVMANDTDVDGGLASITSVTQPAHGTVVITGGGSGLTYQPAANYCGADSFTYTRNGGSVATVSMTVTCVDDKPVAVDDAATISEDAGASAIDVLANDTDIDGGAKSVASVTQGAHGAVVITGGGTGLTYNPAANYCGADSFTYDLNGGSTGTVSVTVTCTDDAPVAVDDAKTVTEDAAATAVDVLANDTDVDGGTMSIASVTQGAHGAVVITGGGTGLTYQPDANYCGADSFTYDLNGGSTGTVSVTVTCVDDAPVAVDDAAAMLKNASATAVDVLANDTDIDGGTKSITGVTQGGHGAVVITGGGSGLTYEPDPGYCNTGGGTDDTFTYTLNGGSTATVSVTVACDAPPVAVDDAKTVTEDDPATAVDVLANDTDVDGGPKSVESVTQGAHGAVVITGGGTGLTYQPAANYCGSDSFTYTLNGGSTGTVSVTVTCVDDPPVAVDDSATVTEDDPATAVDVLANDTDVDAGTKSVMAVTQGTHGTVVITGGGTGLTYQPAANYCGSDSFTYDLNGGSSATVSMTVTCVNDAPVADDETFNAADSAVGNTSLVVDAPGDGAPAQPGPKKSISGDILTGDTDIDGPDPLAVVPGTFATNDGGSVTLQADGDFVYHPKAGTSCTDHSDFFDYTVTDGNLPTAGTDTGQVTIAIAGCVWYVDNTASGDGTAASPFATLAQAQTASAAGDTIFVFKGDGTTTGYDAGIDLKANQQLVGEVIGLQVGSDLLYAAVPGARPKLTDTNADVVVLASGDTVTGFLLDPQGTGGGIAGGAGVAAGTIADVRVIDTGTAGSQPGLELDGTTGTFAVSDLTVDNSGATAPPATAVGVRLNNAGTATFATAGTISITTKGAPGLTADSTALGAGSVFDDITVTDSSAGGVSMTSTTGTTTFSALSLTTTSGATAAFRLSNAGTVTVTGAGTADVSATGGPAVDVTGTPGAALAFDAVTSTNSAGDGVNLAGLGSGTFSANASSAITDAAGIDVDLDGGSGAVTYAGTITDDQGQLVRVQNTSGGTKSFTGAITDGGDGDGSGIAVTSNAGATVRFDGGLTLATGANAAFAATGGGTVAVTDPAGAASNTVQTTTGVAVDVVSTTIHADGLTFERVSSNGAPVGIRLSATGSSGGLTVTGSGSAACSNGSTAGCTGGTIANGTGADSSAATPTGTGIVLNDTKDPSFTRMWLHDFSNYAVRGTGVTGFVLDTSVVNGTNGDNANAPFADSSVRFDNLTGSASVTGSYISGGLEDGFSVVNTAGSLDRLTVTGTTFGGGASARPTNDALHLETSSSASQLKATITGSTFSNAAGDLLGYSHGGTGAGDLVLTGNAFSNTNTSIATGGGGVTLTQSGVSGGDTTMNISNNSFRDAVGPGVLIVKSIGPATQSGTFANNTIGVSGVDNSGSAEGSALKLQLVDQGSSTWAVTNNQIYGYNENGIEVLAGGGFVPQSGTVNATITGNTVAQPGNTPGKLGNPKQGVHFNIGTVSGDTFTACADIGGAGALANTIDASGADSTPSTINVDVRLRQRQATTIRLRGYTGANNDNTAVQNYVNARNSAGTTTLAANSVATGGGGFVNTPGPGAACPQP